MHSWHDLFSRGCHVHMQSAPQGPSTQGSFAAGSSEGRDRWKRQASIGWWPGDGINPASPSIVDVTAFSFVPKPRFTQTIQLLGSEPTTRVTWIPSPALLLNLPSTWSNPAKLSFRKLSGKEPFILRLTLGAILHSAFPVLSGKFLAQSAPGSYYRFGDITRDDNFRFTVYPENDWRAAMVGYYLHKRSAIKGSITRIVPWIEAKLLWLKWIIRKPVNEAKEER